MVDATQPVTHTLEGGFIACHGEEVKNKDI